MPADQHRHDARKRSAPRGAPTPVCWDRPPSVSAGGAPTHAATPGVKAPAAQAGVARAAGRRAVRAPSVRRGSPQGLKAGASKGWPARRWCVYERECEDERERARVREREREREGVRMMGSCWAGVVPTPFLRPWVAAHGLLQRGGAMLHNHHAQHNSGLSATPSPLLWTSTAASRVVPRSHPRVQGPATTAKRPRPQHVVAPDRTPRA